MKRTLSFILSIVMLFSSLSISAFAEEASEIVNEVQTEGTTEFDESKIGVEVTIGDSMYYIEEGNLLLSVDYARPKTIDTDVFWVVEDAGNVYYSKHSGNNTYVYKVGDDQEFAKLFYPVECFDVDGEEVYHLWNGDVAKQNVNTNEEIILFTNKNACKFYLNEGNVHFIESRNTTIMSSNGDTIDGMEVAPNIEDDPEFLVSDPSIHLNNNESWLWPVKNYHKITSEYANRSFYNSSKKKNVTEFHYAIDIAGSYNGKSVSGQPVLASKSGKIKWQFVDYGGNAIYIDHGDGYVSRYLHMSGYANRDKYESNGCMVKQGDIIGYVGGTSRSTTDNNAYGHHLDFKITYNGKPVNTMPAASQDNIFSYSHPERINQSNETRNRTITYVFDSHQHKWNSTSYCECGAEHPGNDVTSQNTGDLGIYTRGSGKVDVYRKPNKNNRYKIDTVKSSKVSVIGVYTNTNGTYNYKISYDGKDGDRFVNRNDFKKVYTRTGNLPSDIKFNDINYPSKLNKGNSFGLRGSVTSSKGLEKVTGNVYNAETGKPMFTDIVDTKYQGTTSCNLQNSNINTRLTFGTLPVGNYYIFYTAKEIGGGIKEHKTPVFAVGNVGIKPVIVEEKITGGMRATISCSDKSAVIKYTVDGGSAKTISAGQTGTVDLKKAGSHTIIAWSVKDALESSKATKTIDIKKSKLAQILEYILKQGLGLLADIEVEYGKDSAYVVISGEGDTYYTLDGSTPNEYSKKYTEPIPITESCTVKAISIEYGAAPSDVATKEIIVKEPDPPKIALFNTKEKIAQGKVATVSWEPVKYATSYKAYLYKDGVLVEETTDITGTTASFVLNERSDTENFLYEIKVVANNFKGDSLPSNAVQVMAMHPVTVTFVDRITRTGELTEGKLEEVKERINEHEKNDRGYNLEGQILSIQKVDYDSIPSRPAVPSKKGFDFAGWSAELFQPALTDTTVYADYEIKYYTVSFYDIDDSFNRESQPLSDERYMYTDVATPPTDNKNEVGYALAGWTVDVANSEGTDYNYVDGDMIVDAIYKWANMDLPAVLEITSVIRDDKSYRVNIRLKNNNELTTQARVVVGLYTSEGKNVYSQISEQDLDLGNFSSWGTLDEITLIYSGKIAYAKAFLVAVENDRTGGALSQAAYYDEITYDTNSNYYKNNGYWGPWTAWTDTKATASEFVQVESKPQYRYRDKQTTTTDNSKTLSGWNYDHTDSRTGSWVYNGTNWVGTENSEWRKREVSTNWVAPTYKTQWHYFTWYKGSSAPWSHYSSSHPYLAEIWIDYELPWNRYSGGLDQYGGSGYNFGYQFYRWLKADGSTYGLPTSSTPYFTRSVQTGGGYTEYSYRDTYYTHHFWKWGNWSSWSDYYPTTSSNREIASKTQWRSREWIFNYDPSNEPEEESNIYPTIEGVLNSGETEYITEDELNEGNYSVLSGPFYKDDDGKYVEIESRDSIEYRYGRYTNGTYVMPCKELAEELYGGEWELEYTEWSEDEAEIINDNVYSCENIAHTHADAIQKDGMNYWNEYVIGEKSYCFVESRELTKEITYTDTNKYYLVHKDLEGKVATVLVYKKTNTDPTQGQLEYADQITVGSGNTYEVTINTKELCEYGKTDDFIVSIALEGCKKLLTVGVIEAEAPQYEVCFTVNGEEYIPECNKNIESTFVDDEDGATKYVDEKGNIRSINTVMVDEGESIDVNAIGIPEIEGYRFVKWDKSLVNITGRVDVKAVLEKEDYAIVFVDHANETVELQELYYGDPISAPEVKPVEGKIFKGWDNQSYRYVLEEEKDNERYTVVDGPYYRTSGDVYIPVDEYSNESLIDGTKYYRVLTDEIPVVTGNMVITAIWESITYKVTFCDMNGNVIHEEEVEHGEAATPPPCLVVDGVQLPWSTNDKAWWNVDSDMVIYPYSYVPNNVVSPSADVATGTYDEYLLVNLETPEDTPVYYSTSYEITEEDALKYVEMLNSEEIQLMSQDVEVEDDAEGSYDSDAMLFDSIEEYSEPIPISYSTIIYAFTVKDGEISPISAFEYNINGSEKPEDVWTLGEETEQITMPSISVKPGETVDIPVTIKNNPGLKNLSLVIGYDANNLDLIKVANGEVFSATEFSSDTRKDGSCKLEWFTTTENSKNGTLVILTFKAKSGIIGDYSVGMDVVANNGDGEEEYFAVVNGNINNMGEDILYGDANGDGKVNFADAIILIRYDIGFATLNEHQLGILDVNSDGDVDFADAIKILRFDAGLISSLK